MIEFASEAIRTAFHSLPIAEQMHWIRLSKCYIKDGRVLVLTDLQNWDAANSEISVRIVKKFVLDSSTGGDLLDAS